MVRCVWRRKRKLLRMPGSGDAAPPRALASGSGSHIHAARASESARAAPINCPSSISSRSSKRTSRTPRYRLPCAPSPAAPASRTNHLVDFVGAQSAPGLTRAQHRHPPMPVAN
jgi:hypothetical protein